MISGQQCNNGSSRQEFALHSPPTRFFNATPPPTKQINVLATLHAEQGTSLNLVGVVSFVVVVLVPAIYLLCQHGLVLAVCKHHQILTIHCVHVGAHTLTCRAALSLIPSLMTRWWCFCSSEFWTTNTSMPLTYIPWYPQCTPPYTTHTH